MKMLFTSLFLAGSWLVTVLSSTCLAQQWLRVAPMTRPNFKWLYGVTLGYQKAIGTHWYYGVNGNYIVNRVIPYRSDTGYGIGVSLNQLMLSGTFGYAYTKFKVEPFIELEAGGSLNAFKLYPSNQPPAYRNMGFFTNPKLGVRRNYESVGLFAQVSYLAVSVDEFYGDSGRFRLPFDNTTFLISAGGSFRLKRASEK